MENREIIEGVVNKVISKVDNNWSKLQKIRFVYLELGKYLEKNTDFFLNDKLDKFALSEEEMSDIYRNDKVSISNRGGVTQYQVICKSAALFLKIAFDKLGIDANFLHTPGDEKDVLHWFIIVKDDTDKQYFLTLAADLAYIKNYMITSHFANSIRYLDDNGNPLYIIPEGVKNLRLRPLENDKGKLSNVSEIDYTVLTREELRALDESIGYSASHKLSALATSENLTKDFYVYMEEEHSKIFEIYRNSFNISKGNTKRISEITEEEVKIFKKQLNSYVGDELDRILEMQTSHEFDNLDDSFKNHVIKLLAECGIFDVDNLLSVTDLLKKYKNELQSLKDGNYKDALNLIRQVSNIENRFDRYISLRKLCIDLGTKINKELLMREQHGKNDDSVSKAYDELEQKYKELTVAQKSISMSELNESLYRLSFHFLKDQIYVDKRSEYIPVDYVIKKFGVMFSNAFECNFENIKANSSTEFSIQNYSEQSTAIKEFLKTAFPELTEKNCQKMDGYNKNYSPVENRVQLYPLKDKETGEYCVGFEFGKMQEENSSHYVYIPSENLLRQRVPLEDRNKFWIVSRRFNDKIAEKENIEGDSKKTR